MVSAKTTIILPDLSVLIYFKKRQQQLNFLSEALSAPAKQIPGEEICIFIQTQHNIW